MSDSSLVLTHFSNSIDLILRSQPGSGQKIADLLTLHEKAPKSDQYACTCALVAALVALHDKPE